MAKQIYLEFGRRLAAARKEAGLTQAEVAERLGTVQSTYSGYELGTRKVTGELIAALSDILDVSPDYLVKGTKKNKPTGNESDELILDIFHQLTPQNREKLLDLAKMFSDSQKDKISN